MSLADEFGSTLRAIRRQQGHTQEGLGRMAGMNRTTVGLLENGKREPRLTTIVKLADALA